ncbi:MAG: hypothetical protein LBB53_01180 [Prevotellaceae bacterium]|nr:hypothetical protein [Prevotellaceae bacterium]
MKIRQFWQWAAGQVAEIDRQKFPHNLPLNPADYRTNTTIFSMQLDTQTDLIIIWRR